MHYLVHVIYCDGIFPDPAKIDRICRYPIMLLCWFTHSLVVTIIIETDASSASKYTDLSIILWQ